MALSLTDWRTVVSRGTANADISRPSKPTTDTSPGTSRPHCLSPATIPSARMSPEAKTAVISLRPSARRWARACPCPKSTSARKTLRRSRVAPCAASPCLRPSSLARTTPGLAVEGPAKAMFRCPAEASFSPAIRAPPTSSILTWETSPRSSYASTNTDGAATRRAKSRGAMAVVAMTTAPDTFQERSWETVSATRVAPHSMSAKPAPRARSSQAPTKSDS